MLARGLGELTGCTGEAVRFATACRRTAVERGFLAPALTDRFGFTRGTLLTGTIWIAWHLPILLFADYNSATPWWFAMSCFALGLMGFRFVSNWPRLKAGNLWVAAVLHASHNAFVQGFFSPLTASKGLVTAYAIDEFGFVLPLVYAAIGFFFWTKRRALRGAARPHPQRSS